MRNGKLESTEQILPNLFNSHKRRNKAVFSAEIQEKYWQHFLEERWEDICGTNLKKLCYVEKLEGNLLTICSSSSMMSNELFMMKRQLLKKINFILQGMWNVKDINFHVGNMRVEKKSVNIQVEEEEVKAVSFGKCKKCGSRLSFPGELCCLCSREAQQELRNKIRELLLIEPWLDYNNCLKYLNCDKILFTAVKDELKNYFFEKVRNDFSDEREKIMAVMLLTGNNISEIDEKSFNNAIAFLRRNKNVSTRRV